MPDISSILKNYLSKLSAAFARKVIEGKAFNVSPRKWKEWHLAFLANLWVLPAFLTQ